MRTNRSTWGGRKTQLVGPALVAAAAAAAVMSATANASVIADHEGSANPTSEGWSLTSAGTGASAGPVTGPPAAWNVNDNGSGNPGGRLFYSATVNGGSFLSGGWELDATVNDESGTLATNLTRDVDFVNVSVSGDVTTDTEYELNFGSATVAGATVATVFEVTSSNGTVSSGPSFTLSTGGFHSYSLIFDPVAGASLYVDGDSTPVLTGYVGYTITGISTTEARFGSVSNPNVGSADYASVKFSTVPEPASLALFGAPGWRPCDGAVVRAFDRRLLAW